MTPVIWAGMERILKVEETSAEYLVTACPFRLLNLREAAKALKSKIKIIYDCLEILAGVV